MTKIVGIDFGTSNVRISQWDDEVGIPSSCQIGRTGSDSRFTMPTVIAFRRQPNGEVVTTIGEKADELDERAPDVEVVRNIKRWALTTDAYVRQQLAWYLERQSGGNEQPLPEWLALNPPSIRIWNETMTAADAIKEILKEAISRAGLAGSAAEWRAGCPVDSDLAYREALVSALAELGCKGKIEWTTEEPLLLLSLIKAIAPLEDGLRYLVYDVGGGSFDCAIVDATDSQLIVLASEGLPMGGIDIDDAIMNKLGYTVPHQIVRIAKQQLYPEDDHDDAPTEVGLGGGQTLSRNDVEDALRKTGFLNETLRAIVNAYSKAQIQITGNATYGGRQSDLIKGMRNDIDRVLVVGGSTRMPYFRERLGEIFGAAKVMDAKDLIPEEYKGEVPDVALTALSHGACFMYRREDGSQGEDRYIPLTVDRIPAKITLSITDGNTTVKDSYRPFERLPFGPPTDPHLGQMLYRRAVNEGESSTLDPTPDSFYTVLIEDADERVVKEYGPYEMRMPRDGYTGPRADRIRLIIDRLGRVGVELGAGFTHVPKPLSDFKVIAESTVWQTEGQIKVIEDMISQGRLYLERQNKITERNVLGHPWEYPF